MARARTNQRAAWPLVATTACALTDRSVARAPISVAPARGDIAPGPCETRRPNAPSHWPSRAVLVGNSMASRAVPGQCLVAGRGRGSHAASCPESTRWDRLSTAHRGQSAGMGSARTRPWRVGGGAARRMARGRPRPDTRVLTPVLHWQSPDWRHSRCAHHKAFRQFLRFRTSGIVNYASPPRANNLDNPVHTRRTQRQPHAPARTRSPAYQTSGRNHPADHNWTETRIPHEQGEAREQPSNPSNPRRQEQARRQPPNPPNLLRQEQACK